MNYLMQRYYRSRIVPYLEGTLDARRRTQLEAQLARDPQLADELVKHRSVAERLQAHRPAAPSDAHADRAALWPRIERRLQPRRAPIRSFVLAGAGLAAAVTVWGTLSISHGPAATPPPPHAAAIIRDARNLEPLPMPKLRRHHRSRVFPHPLVRLEPTHAAADREPLLALRPKNPSGEGAAAGSDLGQNDGPTVQEAAAGSKPTVRNSEEQDAAARFHLATGITSSATRDDPGAAEDTPSPDPASQSAAPTDSTASAGTASDTNAETSMEHREWRGHRHPKRQHPVSTVTIE